jgi:hypothetical protein
MALGHFPVLEYMLLVLLLLWPLWLLRLLLLMLMLCLLLLSLSLLHVPARFCMVFLMGQTTYSWERQSFAQESITSSSSGGAMVVFVRCSPQGLGTCQQPRLQRPWW